MFGKEWICVRCGHIGKPKKRARGSFGVEIVLWLLLIIPGLVYSAWRMFSPTIASCRSCGSQELVPLNSPRGRELVKEPTP